MIGLPNCTRSRRTQPQVERDWATPTARAAVWMRALSKVCMSCLKPCLLAAEQVFRLHLEAIEADFILLHAAIAEHLDLAAGHAFGRERVFVGAARLFGEEHGQALVTGLVRVGAGEHGHHVGAHRVGDPGLVAGDLVDVALLDGAGAQRGQVRAGVRLGENGGGQDLAGCDLRQPLFCFCSSVPPARMSSAAISERVPSEPMPI
jgi:hypothetical protein